MEKLIKDYLKKIESEYDVKILLACETGSRAWGFPSPDSDFDVRILYVHKLNWYLKLDKQSDTIDKMFEENEIDVSGWELRKALYLLKKSNAPLLERIQSSIIYESDEYFVNEINRAADIFYSKIATMHHYLSMGFKFYNDLHNASSYKLKHFFYMLRSALVCKWVEQKDVMPPIDFLQIYPNLDLSKNLVERIDDLIKFKSTKDESYVHEGESELFNLIGGSLMHAEKIQNQLPGSKGQLSDLNDILSDYIYKYDY